MITNFFNELFQDIVLLCKLPTFILIIIIILLTLIFAGYRGWNKKYIEEIKESHAKEIINFKNSSNFKEASVITTIFPYNDDEKNYLNIELQVLSTMLDCISEAECWLILKKPLDIKMNDKTSITYQTSSNRYIYPLADNLFIKSAYGNYKKLNILVEKSDLVKHKIRSLSFNFMHQNIEYEYTLDI